MPFDLPDDTWHAFMRGIARGSYYLLLGAGASRDGEDSFGDPLPLGTELANDLIEEFELPVVADALDLQRAYEAALRRERGRNYPSVDSYLHERFLGCKSPDWFTHLTAIRWRRIYTLNIDDTLDHAYLEHRDERAQKPRITHWSHPFFDDAGTGFVAVVHLHGRARLLGEDHENNLVFGLEQYFDATATQHAWHRIFGDTFQSSPFLVVGATLSQELDLASILRRSSSAMELTGMPSLVVLPQIDAILHEELEAFGLVPVATSGHEFFEQVASALPQFLRELPMHDLGGPTPQTLKFLSQFRQLTLARADELDRHHDLYSGHEPTWQDIVREREARFDKVGPVVELAVKAVNRETTERVFCLHGGPFTGKSTTLLRVGREVITAGADVFLFVGDERPDMPALSWWLQRSGPTVLLFDGLADFGAELAAMFETIDMDQVRLAIVGCERDVRVDGLVARLPTERFNAGPLLQLDRLSDDDISALIARLRDAGRLGLITQRNRGGQLVYFRTEHHRELFPAMAGLEHAHGFAGRLQELWRGLSRSELRDAYAACAMIHSLGYQVPAPLAAAVSGLQVRDLVRALSRDEAFGELITISNGSLKTRQRALASLFIDEVLDQDQRYGLSSALATSIAQYVSPQAIVERSVYARIIGQLMDERNVRRWIGQSRINDWYDDQAESYGWNARFWEQRALAATRLGHWDRAESYAEQAVDILGDPFTFNTLGTTLLRKADADTDPGSEARWSYYRRAVDALTESRREGRERFMHPYVTFFEYTLRLCNSERQRGFQIPNFVSEAWKEWLDRARNSPAFADPTMRQQLEGYVTDWLMGGWS